MFNLYEMCAKIEERSKIKNRLKQEVDEQTRNGRDELYLRRYDLEQFGYETDSTDERIYITLNEFNNLLSE